MKNRSVLVTVYADAPGTAETIASALETIGRVSAVASTDIETSPSSRHSGLSYRILLDTPHETPHPPLRTDLTEAECTHIRTVLERFGWRCSAAAKALGIDRSTLYRKMKRYRISKDS